MDMGTVGKKEFGRTPHGGTPPALPRFRRPDPLTLRALLVRGAAIWLLVRVIYTGISVGMGGGFVLPPAAMPLLAAVVAGIVLVDLRAVRDDVLLANLGVGARHVLLVAFAVAMLAEAVLSAVAALAGA